MRSGSKYKNRISYLDGISFDSKAESLLYLKFKEDPNIEILKLQDSVYMTDARVLYKPDFKLKNLETGEEYWAEMKGIETPVWRIKRRLWIAGYGMGKLEVWKNRSRGPFLYETINPKG